MIGVLKGKFTNKTKLGISQLSVLKINSIGEEIHTYHIMPRSQDIS